MIFFSIKWYRLIPVPAKHPAMVVFYNFLDVAGMGAYLFQCNNEYQTVLIENAQCLYAFNMFPHYLVAFSMKVSSFGTILLLFE